MQGVVRRIEPLTTHLRRSLSSAPFVYRNSYHDATRTTLLPATSRTTQQTRTRWIAVGAGLLGLLPSAFFLADEGKDTTEEEPTIVPGTWKKGLPEYTTEEVSKHTSSTDGIWVTYKEGVYDITEFVESHPGGENRIMLAAGSSIAPYWNLYAQHHKDNVYEILESWRIGNLSDYDAEEGECDASDPFCNDPKRSPALVVNSPKPFNAETPLVLLTEKFNTPTPLFYVRNHLPVPLVDAETYELEVVVGDQTKSYSLSDLQQFEQHTITAAIQCAGNRRNQLNEIQNVKGLVWRGGAIGNATWTGVWLRDVLLDAGYDPSHGDASQQHCQFVGLDNDGTEGSNYGASIPLRKATDPYGDVLLAFQMNGEELTPDHGYPVRVVVPGHVGARNVKWVSKVTVEDSEIDSHWQKKDYKSFSPAVDFDHIPWESAPAIQDLPVQSLICVPPHASVLSSDVDELELSGYAWSGGGRGIIRVDIKINDKEWYQAELEQEEQSANRNWGWTLWKVTVPIPEDYQGEVKISCRAVDESYNSQPENAENVWNVRGLVNNSWHSIVVTKE